MVTIEEIDEKLRHAFEAVKKDMLTLNSKIEQIDKLRNSLNEHKAYTESLNRMVINSVSSINKDIEELKEEIKNTKLRSYRKVLKGKLDKIEKDKKGIIDKFVDIFADEDDK